MCPLTISRKEIVCSLIFTNKVIKMNGMFNGCSSLVIIPDISKWKTDNLTETKLMFYGCSSLLVNPDISKWNENIIKKEAFYPSSRISNSEMVELNSYSNYISSVNDNSIDSEKNKLYNIIKEDLSFSFPGLKFNDYYENQKEIKNFSKKLIWMKDIWKIELKS